MIIAENICKSYGRSLVVDNISLTIQAGGLTSIIGPNGAGKSTLLSIIARLLGLDKGKVSVAGLDVNQTPTDILAQRISILRQDNHLSSRLTVRELVSFGRYPYSHGRLTRQDKTHITQALDYLELQSLGERFLDELSGGQRQRAFVAMLLCQDTDYLLLDEPLNNLDMKHASSMMKILRRAANELNKTVVLVLHDINFAAWYSDCIIAMKDGKLWGMGNVDAMISSEVLEQIYEMPISIHRLGERKIALFYE